MRRRQATVTRASSETGHRVALEALETVATISAMLREGIKTIVIVSYLGFAIWTLIVVGNPYGFLPLLPWALWSRAERPNQVRRRNRKP
jgi:hypothetical protein